MSNNMINLTSGKVEGVDNKSVNFNQFKVVLFEASRIIYKNLNPFESCAILIKDKILPLYDKVTDSRSVQNIKL